MTWKPGSYTLLVDASPDDHQAKIVVKETVKEWIAPFGDDLGEHWKKQPDLGADTWEIDPADGALVGTCPKEAPGILWCDVPLQGDHMIEMQACTVEEYVNDISAIWEGWGPFPKDTISLGGIGGWWNGYSGVEATTGARCTTPTGVLVPDQKYNISGGRVTTIHTQHTGESDEKTQKNLDFLFVDGKLVQQVTQEVKESGWQPRQQSRVAITTWKSKIKVYRIRISTLETIYTEATTVPST